MKNILTAMGIGLVVTLGIGILFTSIGGLFYIVGKVSEMVFGEVFGIVGSLFIFTFLALSVATYVELLKGKNEPSSKT